MFFKFNLFNMNAVHCNSKILDLSNNYLFLKAFYIKTLKPTTNDGRKGSEEFQLFKQK